MCGLRASAGLGQFERELGDASESEAKVTVFWGPGRGDKGDAC